MLQQIIFRLRLKSFAGKGLFLSSFSIVLLFTQFGYSQTTPEITMLELDKPFEQEIVKGQKHDYQISLKAGDYAAFTVLERKIELKVIVTDPQNKQIMEVEAPYSQGEPQSINFIAEISGNYLLSVLPSSQNAPTGGFEINLKEVRTATETDRTIAESLKLNLETRKLRNDGKYDEALAVGEKALALLAKLYDAENVENADIINEIGSIYDEKGEYPKAEQYYLRALKMYEKKYGTEHFFVATVLNNLGAIYRTTSEYEKAESAYKRALEINEKTFNPEHLNVAQVLANLAYFYYTKGEYTKAESLYQRVLLIREKQMGSDDFGVGATLNNLAMLYRVKGDYSQAIPLFQRVLTIFEKNLPPGHPNIAVILGNLAAVNTEIGDYEKAEQLYKRALEIGEKTLSPEHPDVANMLNNLGSLYDSKGEYEKAELLYQRALVIREKVFGAEHPLVAVTLNNLAMLYRTKGEYDKAEPLFIRALEIAKKKLGDEHSGIAGTLNNLALLYYDKDDYKKAEPMFQQALAIFEKANGKNHPFTSRPLYNLSLLYAAKGDFAQALDYQEKYLAVRERNLELNLFTGSERQKIAYLDTLSRDMMSTISLHMRLMPESKEAQQTALELIFSRKGRSLDAMSGTISALRRRALPEDQKIIDQLSDVRTKLANLTLRGIGNDKPEIYQQRLETIEAGREKLEDDLSRRSSEFRASSQMVTFDSVRAAIPENAALLEFVSYSPVNLKSKLIEKSLSPQQYIVYILRRQGEIQWKELGDAKIIDAAIDDFRQALRDPKRKDVGQLARIVDEKVMSPVRRLLGDATHLFISPDGNLNLIPFDALVDEKEKYLVENFQFTYLTSGRDLLRMQTTRENKSKSLIIADPLFGEPANQLVAAISSGRKPKTIDGKRKSITATRNLSETYFSPLGGTLEEARSIKTLFPDAISLTEAQATETALKQVSSPRILHIATHGFFLQDAENTSGIIADTTKREAGVNAKIENPLLRSGLALAGANERKSGADDGILTALEASGLNLWGTKLVVLSACDTGLGEVKNGEGVYGLRRAFVLAGTESLVMSLWSVSDYTTRELMTNYYKNLKQGMGRGEALRKVQLEMLKRENRQHPFYWAGFIQSGEWANLDGKR